jgi:hypothetical protein
VATPRNLFRFQAVQSAEFHPLKLPGEAGIDYPFIRLSALIALVLRQTGRMTQ